MKRVRLLSVTTATLAALTLSACVGQKARTVATITPPPKAPFATNINASAFDKDSATIDNQWWPLKPGTQLTWEGEAFDGEDRIRRRVVFTVTDLTKEVGGVVTLVGYDLDFNNGKLAESELIFLAQDKEGNVWHLGQYAERYDEEGQFEGGIAWLAGYLDGAKAGILMGANPQPNTPEYSEGFAPPPYFWDDFGRVFQTGQKTCARAGCYSDVLVIEEFEPTKPGASQLKYYARGVGLVRIGWRGEEEEERETMDLVRVVTLSPEALAEARAASLALESRAYVYGLTSRAQPRVEPTT